MVGDHMGILGAVVFVLLRYTTVTYYYLLSTTYCCLLLLPLFYLLRLTLSFMSSFLLVARVASVASVAPVAPVATLHAPYNCPEACPKAALL